MTGVTVAVDAASPPPILGKGIFGPTLDPATLLMGLVADVSSIRATSADTNRRLGAIEAVTNQTAAAVDKTSEILATHAVRLKTLEKDLIQNGELRMASLEKTRGWVLGLVGSSALSAASYVGVTYVFPVLKAMLPR